MKWKAPDEKGLSQFLTKNGILSALGNGKKRKSIDDWFHKLTIGLPQKLAKISPPKTTANDTKRPAKKKGINRSGRYSLFNE